jgi:hypothetical protein
VFGQRNPRAWRPGSPCASHGASSARLLAL